MSILTLTLQYLGMGFILAVAFALAGTRNSRKKVPPSVVSVGILLITILWLPWLLFIRLPLWWKWMRKQ